MKEKFLILHIVIQVVNQIKGIMTTESNQHIKNIRLFQNLRYILIVDAGY